MLVTANSSAVGTRLGGFLARMAAMAKEGPLKGFDPAIYMLQYTTVATPRVTGDPYPDPGHSHSRSRSSSPSPDTITPAPAPAPAGMVAIPAAVPYFDYAVTASVKQQYCSETLPKCGCLP